MSSERANVGGWMRASQAVITYFITSTEHKLKRANQRPIRTVFSPPPAALAPSSSPYSHIGELTADDRFDTAA